MIQTESRRIGDADYEVTQLPSGRGRKLLLRLFRVLGPAIGELVAGKGEGALPAALQELAARLTEEDLEYAVQQLAGDTRVRISGGNPLPLRDCIDQHFAGNYGEMLEWIGFALEVNYRTFFNGLPSLKGQPPHPMSGSPSPTA